MWKINEENPCSHSSIAYAEVVKHTIVSTHHPITNSRVQSINDFEVAKVKEIKVPALKCLDCGEIIETKLIVDQFSKTNEFDYGYSQKCATLTGYNSKAIGSDSIAIGSNSCAVGNYNIAIGAGAGRYSTGMRYTGMTYAGDYSPSYTTRNITDKKINMGFLDDMSEALKNAENRQKKVMKSYESKQLKLDKIAEKVRALRKNMSGENSLTTEIDRIKAEYDQIVNRQETVQQTAQQQFRNTDVFSTSIRNAAKLMSPPPPPPHPQARKIGGKSLYGQDRGYYQPTTPPPNISEFTDIEYVQFLIRNTEVEEKTFKDIKYLDFIFLQPIGQENPLLNILEKGDVIEWVKVPKNKKMGMLSSKIKLIKAIRISVKDLEEARKAQTNES